MGGGLVQLSAYGSQDVYLTSNPTITFFKAVYQRHTNFSSESIVQLIDGNINFGGNITAVVARNGDLFGNVVVECYLPNPANYVVGAASYDYFGYIQGVGNYLIKNVTVEIGGQQIDEQYGTWMDIWSELNLSSSQVNGYGTLVGKGFSQAIWQPYDVTSEPGSRLQIPLLFWFCRNPGLAIPLIALQYHEIRIKATFESFKNLIVAVNNGQYVTPVLNGINPILNATNKFKIWNTYYFLDTIERRKFAQNPHEYLIEQVQSQTGNVTSLTGENQIRINLNHPTKELIFIFKRNGTSAPQNDFSIGTNIIPNGTSSQFSPLYSFKLLVNGTDRFKERNGEYFRLVQCYDHHTRVPANYIYVYSFALRPEEHQPSGTCNFSRIDTALLDFYLRNSTTGPGNLDGSPQENYTDLPGYSLFAPSYNILRIMGGMAGLAYSN
jgi:hypothetical protein